MGMIEHDQTDSDLVDILDLRGETRGGGPAGGEAFAAGIIYAGIAMCLGVFLLTQDLRGSAHQSPVSSPVASSVSAGGDRGGLDAFALIAPATSPPRVADVAAPKAVRQAASAPRISSPATRAMRPAHERRFAASSRSDARRSALRRLRHSDGLKLARRSTAAQPVAVAAASVTSGVPRTRTISRDDSDLRVARAERLEAVDSIWLLRQR